MVFFVTSTAVMTTITVILLILKQIFWGLRRDRSSNFPVPPRYIIGKDVFPISGSTSLFKRTGSRIYDCFDAKWTQIHFHVPFFPSSWCKELGEVFSIFVWGNWRTIINGEERVGKVIDEGGLIPSWPYFWPPEDLLGKSCCLCFLKDAEEKHRMKTVIRDILCQENIISFASDFSIIADSYVEHFLCKTSMTVDVYNGGIFHRVKAALGLGLSHRRESQELQSYTGNQLLKSYSLELVNGPLFGLHRYFKSNEISQEPRPPSSINLTYPNHLEVVESKEMPIDDNMDKPIRKLEVSWLDSFQHGILSFKLNFWLLSEYGRAKHARHLIVDGVLNNVVSRERKKFAEKEGMCCHKGGAKLPRGDLGLLDSIFSRDSCTDIFSDEAVAEFILMIWLMMDKGRVWTTTALHLLQNDQEMFYSIHNEIHLLQDCYGENGISSEGALSQMYLLDALIFDAIKLSPPFFGGMWKMSNTIELKDDMVQVPKRSNVLLMSCSRRRDDISDANLLSGKNLQTIGEKYPNTNLYGFLPLNGEEVPLIVLQTKIFLISVIRKCDLTTIQQWKQAENPKL